MKPRCSAVGCLLVLLSAVPLWAGGPPGSQPSPAWTATPPPEADSADSEEDAADLFPTATPTAPGQLSLPAPEETTTPSATGTPERKVDQFLYIFRNGEWDKAAAYAPASNQATPTPTPLGVERFFDFRYFTHRDRVQVAQWLGRSPFSNSDSEPISLEASAASGDPTFQLILGWSYLTGCWQPVDYAQAATLLQKSSDQGNKEAEALLGLMYRQGWG